METLFALLALPHFGLSTLFLAAFISATLLPIGSEPALFGLLKLNPDLFWSAIFVATAGNTLGGMLDWWMGYEAHHMVDKYRHSRTHAKALAFLEKLGPKACLLAWLPIVGDPLYGGIHRRVPGDLRAVTHLDRPFLHAARLVFTHPVDERRMEFDSVLPDDLQQVLEELRERFDPTLHET